MQFIFTEVRGPSPTGIELGEIFLYDADNVAIGVLQSYQLNCFGRCSEANPAANLIDGFVSKVWYDNAGFGCGEEVCSGVAYVTLQLPHPMTIASYRLYTGQGDPANDPIAWRFGILRDSGDFEELSYVQVGAHPSSLYFPRFWEACRRIFFELPLSARRRACERRAAVASWQVALAAAKFAGLWTETSTLE